MRPRVDELIHCVCLSVLAHVGYKAGAGLHEVSTMIREDAFPWSD